VSTQCTYTEQPCRSTSVP